MNSQKNLVDITELIFPLEEPSEQDLENYFIYQKATAEAARIVGTASPMDLLRKTEELYQKYLQEK